MSSSEEEMLRNERDRESIRFLSIKYINKKHIFFEINPYFGKNFGRFPSIMPIDEPCFEVGDHMSAMI